MKTPLTVVPFLLAMFAAVAAMPTNVYQICAWNAGTLEIEPWRSRASAGVATAAQSIRAWLARLCTPRLAFACLAVLMAVLVAHQSGGHDAVLMAIGGVLSPAVIQEKETQRALLMAEAEQLRTADGKFANDADRRTFDAKMAEVDSIDVQLRGQSEFVVERNPLAGGAPAQRMSMEPPAEPNDRDRGAASENERVTGIIDACTAARLPMSFARKLIDDKGISLLEAQRRVFKEMGAREDPNAATPSPSARVEMGQDPYVHARTGIENALLHRVAPNHFKLEDKGREYRGMNMLDVAKAYLQARGIRVSGMGKMEIAGVALGLTQTRGGYHTTSDFPLLLADVANKSLRAEYAAAEQTFQPITRPVSLSDFKPANRVQIGDAPALKPVNEHGEFTRGTIAEGKEAIQLAEYGRVFAITRKALVNDDTDAFSRVPAKFGRMARNLESDLVWYQILSNPTMGDNVALFNAAHANYDSVGAALDLDSISAGEIAMMLQKGIDGATLIMASPKYLIVPPSQKLKALQFVSVNMQAQQAANVNPYAGQLIVIAEPRLETGITIGKTTVSGSSVAWYLAAAPGQTDIIELATLEGQEGPLVESRVGFDVDGLEIKCRHDVGAKVIDHRGLYKNVGAEVS